jgi:hypothetical protein
MISLLSGPDYEMLGSLEIRASDWQRIERMGLMRFLVMFCRASLGARIGALIILGSIACNGIFKIDGAAWLTLALGAFAIGCALVYSLRAWFRMKQRFGSLKGARSHVE